MTALVGSLFSGVSTTAPFPALKARLILGGLAALLICGLSSPPAATTGWRGDVELFAAVETRLRGGESYYDVMGAELRQRLYPTASPFNWRPPLLLSAMAAAPAAIPRILLVVLSFAAMAATLICLRTRPVWVQVVGFALQAGAVAMAQAPTARFLSEPWVGLLILLSAACYVRQNWIAGALLGVLALFIRELAAPYCMICGLFALRHRRWSEVTVWIIGGLACGGYYGWHIAQVWAHALPGDEAHRHSWVRVGGLRFILTTIRLNAWCLVLPSWSPPIMCAIVAASWWSRVATGVRAPALAYLVFFAIVGQPFNDYWGLLTAPLWALAAACGIHALQRLVTEAVRPRADAVPMTMNSRSLQADTPF